jgi:hypothetical protein
LCEIYIIVEKKEKIKKVPIFFGKTGKGFIVVKSTILHLGIEFGFWLSVV